MFSRVVIGIIFLILPLFCIGQDEPVADEISEPEVSEEQSLDDSQEKSKDGKLSLNIIRSFLTQFSFAVSTGYGQTYYRHDLRGFGVYQSELGDEIFIFDEAYFGDNTIPAVYQNWLNNPTGIGGFIIPDPVTGNPVITNGIPVGPNDLVMGYDSIPVGFRSTAHSIPITGTLFFDIDRYRIGGGATFEIQKMGIFKPTQLKDTLRNFQPNFTLSTFKRYFGYVGVIVYESWQYKMLADLQFGKINRGKNFNKSVITSSLYFNAGYTIERSLSEYFKVFARPSIEWKSYTITIPETGLEISHRQPSVFIQIGATIKMPELPRCPVAGCNIQINHVHGSKEYRSKVHPIWKWQNPNYGQNHPTLFRNKRSNKNKDYSY